jgi:hypothetical protein
MLEIGRGCSQHGGVQRPVADLGTSDVWEANMGFELRVCHLKNSYAIHKSILPIQ